MAEGFRIETPGQLVTHEELIPAFGTLKGNVSFGGVANAVSIPVEIPGIAGTTTNSLGEYTRTNVQTLRPITVTARVNDGNRSHISAQATGEIPGNNREGILLEILLPKLGTLAVRVENEAGAGLSGVSLFLKDSFSSDFRLETTTNFQGERSILQVPEGDFELRAEKQGLVLGTAMGQITTHGGGLFSDAARPGQWPVPPLWRKRGTRKSRLETNTENEACSALLARLW